MTLKSPPNDEDVVYDARVPGRFRRIYTIIAVLVVVSMVLGMGGYAVWRWL